MAGDLVRRRVPGADLLNNNARALERARGLLRRPALPAAEVPALVLGEVIDVPRICAVHDKPFVARYIADGCGGFHYSQSIRLKESLRDQYATHEEHSVVISSDACEEEDCAWCGAKGDGAVHCGRCHANICYGRTDAKDYFRCRPSCGSQGPLQERRWAMRGAAPFIQPRAPRSSGG
jgi:hypothetical protein